MTEASASNPRRRSPHPRRWSPQPIPRRRSNLRRWSPQQPNPRRRAANAKLEEPVAEPEPEEAVAANAEPEEAAAEPEEAVAANAGEVINIEALRAQLAAARIEVEGLTNKNQSLEEANKR